jgi:hypothetical protein
MNTMTRLLFGKRYFGKKNEEFKDTILKELAIVGNFNIGDFVPLLRPFDLQGITSQSKQLHLKIGQFFYEMIQDCLKQNGLNDSKDFLNAMFFLPKTNGFGDRLRDNTIKAILNVSYHVLHGFIKRVECCPMITINLKCIYFFIVGNLYIKPSMSK